MSQVLDSILDLVGNTPLVRLRKLNRGVRPTLLAKLEMFNPGNNVKDRIGIRMIRDAERGGSFSAAAPSSSRPPATPAPASRSPPPSWATSPSSSCPTR